MRDDLVAVYKRDLERNYPGKLSADEQAEMARAGDYDALVESLLPLVMHVLSDVVQSLRFELDQDMRSDLLQAGNLAVITAVRSWNPDAEHGKALSSWVCQAIRRDMLREFKKQRQLVTSLYEENVLGITPNFEMLVTLDGIELSELDLPEGLLLEGESETLAERREASELVGRILHSLTDRQRNVVILTELQGLSSREAGEILGVSFQAVAKTRTLALKRLRTEVDALVSCRKKFYRDTD